MVSGCGQYSAGTADVVRPTEPPATAMRAQVVQRNGHLSHQPPSIRPCPAKAASRHALAVIFQSVAFSGRRLDKAKRPRSGWPDMISPRLFRLIGCGRIVQAVGAPKRSVRVSGWGALFRRLARSYAPRNRLHLVNLSGHGAASRV